MIKISFPKYQFKIKKDGEGDVIFDTIRKRWVSLSPEEWVRQNVIQYLLIEKLYPAGLFAVEKEIRMGELRRRCDIVVYDKETLPWMIIECKEMRVPLTVDTLDQVLRYHSSLTVPFIIITNGGYCYGFRKETNSFVEIHDFPAWSST